MKIMRKLWTHDYAKSHCFRRQPIWTVLLEDGDITQTHCSVYDADPVTQLRFSFIYHPFVCCLRWYTVCPSADYTWSKTAGSREPIMILLLIQFCLTSVCCSLSVAAIRPINAAENFLHLFTLSDCKFLFWNFFFFFCKNLLVKSSSSH